MAPPGHVVSEHETSRYAPEEFSEDAKPESDSHQSYIQSIAHDTQQTAESLIFLDTLGSHSNRIFALKGKRGQSRHVAGR
jgi:hypothetical protein